MMSMVSGFWAMVPASNASAVVVRAVVSAAAIMVVGVRWVWWVIGGTLGSVVGLFCLARVVLFFFGGGFGLGAIGGWCGAGDCGLGAMNRARTHRIRWFGRWCVGGGWGWARFVGFCFGAVVGFGVGRDESRPYTLDSLVWWLVRRGGLGLGSILGSVAGAVGGLSAPIHGW